MRDKRAGLVLFAVNLIFGVLCSVLAMRIALLPPLLNVKFSERMNVESSQGQLTLEALDLTREPGEFGRFADFSRFYERQGVLYKIITDEVVKVSLGSEVQEIFPQAMSLQKLPFLFWIQVIVAFGTFVVSSWVWCLHSRKLEGLLFFVGGYCILLASLASAIYSTRELAFPEGVFRALGTFNAIGGGCFGIAIIALFLVYPVRVLYWKQISIIQAIFFGVWVGLFTYQLAWANVNLCIVIQMLIIYLAIGVQFWLSRENAEARARLTWLGISIIFGGGAFLVFNTVPVLLELTPLDQGYSFIFVLMIYLGLAAGLTDFKLYEVGQWIFRLFFYVVGIIAFILVDAGFIYVLKMNRWNSAGLALVITALLFLPLRDARGRFLRKKNSKKHG